MNPRLEALRPGSGQEPAFDPAKAWVSKTLKHGRQILCCRVSPCGKVVVGGGADGKVHRWEVESEAKATVGGHSTWVSALAFRPDGKGFFSVDLHGTVNAWALGEPEGKPLWTVRESHGPEWVRCLAASPDGKLVATGGYDRAVRLWSAEDGKLVREIPGHGGYVLSVAFHPKGLDLASGDFLGNVRQFEVATGKLVREMDAKLLYTRKEDFLSGVGGVRSMAFDGKGETLACSGIAEAKSNTFCPGEPTVLLFDWASGRRTAHLKTPSEKVDGFANEVRFLPDGTVAAVGEGFTTGAVWFWRGAAPEPFHVVPSQAIYTLDLHPDGRRLFVAAFEARGKGGNGRPANNREEYVGNAGQVRVYSLFAKPVPPKPAKPPKK